MRTNVDRTRKEIESIPTADQVFLDGDTDEAIVRAIFEEFDDETEQIIEEMELVDIENVKHVGFGVEVTVR